MTDIPAKRRQLVAPWLGLKEGSRALNPGEGVLGLGLFTLGALGGGGGIRFSNYSGSNLNTWKTALAAVAAGTADARLLCIGDSTVAGVGSTNAFIGGNCVNFGWPALLAAEIQGGKYNHTVGSKNFTISTLPGGNTPIALFPGAHYADVNGI